MIGKSDQAQQAGVQAASRHRRARRWAFLLACTLPAGLVIGCQQQEEKIIHYKAPHAVEVDDDAAAPAKVRLLAALVPHAGQTWFFKLQGPMDVIAKHQTEFDQFLASIHFTGGGDEPVTWKVPAGWEREGAGSPERYATFQVGPKDGGAQLTVTKFPGNVGGLLANVNRWRGQIGLQPTSGDHLAKDVKKITVDGGPAQLVSLAGPGGEAKGMMPPFMQGHPPIAGNRPPMGGGMRPPADIGLHYQKPAGWEELASGGPFAFKKFRVASGSQAAEVSLTPLGGDAGGVVANVNRWRGQIGLQAAPSQQVERDVRHLDADGKTASYVDLIGPEQRMLAVIVPHSGTTWFVKMLGPKDLVGQQKAAFEAFVKSLRFGAGDSHE
ncbi:MAG TPA: hypothetical protein VFA18_14480 [Gemmataceae bacterium]|nr:hypothetical protein [Gemmataceae bacterium]